MVYAVCIDANTVQEFAVVAMLLCVLHEREEHHYPWGFLDKVICKITWVTASEEVKRFSRVPTGIYLACLTFIPFFFSNHAWLLLPVGFLWIWEGIVHIIWIKAAKLDKPYTPWMVTAEIECILAILMFWYLSSHHMVEPIHYLYGFLLMVIWFMLMQRALVHLVWMKYRDLPKKIKENIKRIRAEIKAEKENKK